MGRALRLNCSPVTQQRWRQLAQWPLVVVALVFIAVYSLQVLANLQGPARTASQVALWLCWLAFAVDFVMNLRLAPQKLRWFLTHLHEFAFLVLPALRPLQLLRLVSLVSILQRAADNILRGRFLVYAILAAGVITYIGALSALDLERGAPETGITSFPLALWWALSTVIGMGESTWTVTWPGRVVAVGLMINGMALVGAITATLASWLVDQTDDADDEERERITRERVSDLRDEVRELRRELAELGSQLRRTDDRS